MASEGYPVAKINTEDNLDLSDSFDVMTIPTLLVFENGKETKRLIGFHDKSTLIEALK